MAFEFKLSTDEIREKMFDFIKPVYKNTWDFEVGYINWTYGVYDSESWVGLAICIIECTILLISIIPTEKALKNQFNEDGSRK